MLELLGRNWWIFAIRGIAAILFGVLAFVQPASALAVLVALLGAYLLVDGVSLLISLIRGDPAARRAGWTVGIMGVLGVAVGILTFIRPDWTAISILYVAAFWAIAMGIFQVVSAFLLRRQIEGELWLALGGLLSIAFGIVLVINPGAGLVSLVWLVGFWAVFFGITSLVLAWRLRTLYQDTGTRRAATAS
jgi:uncharacterized membrane protein HdeD (DUF308 family)